MMVSKKIMFLNKKIIAVITVLLFSFVSIGVAIADAKDTAAFEAKRLEIRKIVDAVMAEECKKNKDSCKRSYKEQIHIIGGKKYTRDQLVLDFLQIAFPRYMWLENPLIWNIHNKFLFHFLSSKGALKASVKYAPWAYEYIFRESGRPKFNGLNKWENKIEISVGWPPSQAKPIVQMQERYSSVVKKHIASLIQDLSIITGLPISLINKKDETNTNYAHLRIILLEKINSRNHFKFGPNEQNQMGTPIGKHPDAFQRFLSDAVRFTPFSRSQVDGYFLTDKDNNIKFAVCFLNATLPDDLLKSLTTECMVRALGLPEMLKTHDIGVLGHWNKAYDPYSRRYVLDGDIQPTEEQKQYNEQLKEKINSLIRDEKMIEATNFQHNSVFRSMYHEIIPLPENINMQPVLDVLSEYDRAMLSILYCSTLKSGMSRYKVLDLFYQGNECFDFKKTRRK